MSGKGASPIRRQTLTLHELGWPKPINWYAMVRPGTAQPMRSFPPIRYGPIKASGRLEAYERFAKEIESYRVILIDVVTTAELMRTRYQWSSVLEDWLPDRERNDEPPCCHPQGRKA